MIEVYSPTNSPNLRLAKDGEEWFAFVAVSNGWATRWPWPASPAVIRNLCGPENRVTFYGNPKLAEQVYGIPANEVSTLTAEAYEQLTMRAQ